MPNWERKNFQFDLPEIYQLETTSACNLHCPNCIRLDKRVKRPIGYLNPELVKIMVDRGDFKNSYLVELQMAGEPLLHSMLLEIIGLIKSTGCKVGLSTNGTLIPKQLPAIKLLDYMTVSIDSADCVTYENLRGQSLDVICNNVDTILQLETHPKIDLQVINYYSQEDELPALIALAKDKHWNDVVTCRSIPDCFAAYQGREFPKEQMSGLCINPWMSVSIQWDGDVVPCCFAFGKQVVYGNLNDKSLSEIWNNSMNRQALMTRQRKGKDRMPCSLCYQRSPALFHLRMLKEAQ